jgi:release factor glutamine methyltransferase
MTAGNPASIIFFRVTFRMTERIPEFYPDSDDTYLLIDSLEQDFVTRTWGTSRSFLTFEVGPGGGLVSQSFLKFAQHQNLLLFHIAIDVNMYAARETLRQIGGRGSCDVVNGDTFTFLRPDCKADIIFCNPPYVPSSPINRARDIRASYAGGENGREFIDVFLPIVSSRLARDGVFYFLLEKRNNPEEVCRIAHDQYKMSSTLIREKRIPGEHLFVYRFQFID